MEDEENNADDQLMGNEKKSKKIVNNFSNKSLSKIIENDSSNSISKDYPNHNKDKDKDKDKIKASNFDEKYFTDSSKDSSQSSLNEKNEN
jgi:hypothetical protein